MNFKRTPETDYFMTLYGTAALEKVKEIIILSLEDSDNCKMLVSYTPNKFRNITLYDVFGEYFLFTMDHSKNYIQLKGISEEEAQRRINGFLDEKQLHFGCF